MHSKIYQISRERVTVDDFIIADDFCPENYSHFADYVDDVKNEDYKDLYKALEHLLDGVFTRNGAELTYVGAENFIQNWLNHLKAIVEPLTAESMKEMMPFWLIKSVVDNTHVRSYNKVYFDGVIQDFGDFMRQVFAEMNPGDKLFLGGIVDFHW